MDYFPKISVYNHGGPKMAGREMHKSAKHSQDLQDLNFLSFQQYYDFVRQMPYRDDPTILYNAEIVARPYYLFQAKKLDCKKKATLIAAYCNGQVPKISYKFIAISKRPDKMLHHVFPICKINDGWIVVDPTYSSYFIGEPQTGITKVKIL